MSSRIKTDVKKLFEFWCEVARVKNVDWNTQTNAQTPAGVIVESFPEGFRDKKTMADIPAFAFPCKMEGDAVQSYSFVLTTDDSKWRFGFCRHDPKTDTAMVIITYLPWHDTFLRLLTLLAELRRNDNVSPSDDFRAFLAEAYNRGVPDPGGHLKLFYSGGQSYFVFERPLQFQLPSIPENHNLNLYYNFVDPKNMIAVFAAMLAERRIIFTSRRLDRLSSCIQAANAFLYPMVWQHIFIPVLPMKLKDYLSAPMPYLIGVPLMVLETMTPDELGEVVILNCDTKILESPFDDVREMPTDIVSQLKKQLSNSHEHIGDRVSKIFLGVLVQLISGYRDAVEFRGAGKTFNRDKFIESRPKHLRPFLTKMMDLQIFQQFIDERLQMLNTGLGYSDEFELETARYAEKMKKRRHYEFLNNVKEKTNPAVKSAVKSVKEGSRGMKIAYKDFKSKLRDITPPNSAPFRSHLTSNSQHDRIDGSAIVKVGGYKSASGHHSAPSSPIFSSKRGLAAAGFQYASPEELNGATQYTRRAPPLAMSSSSAHIQSNGYAGVAHGVNHLGTHLAPSPTISPASSLCSSEMNLSQELQNHPLFKPPHVDRSLKPSNSFELNQHYATQHHHSNNYHHHPRITATRTGGPPPARPPPPAAHLLQTLSAPAPLSSSTPTTPYYNHPQVKRQQSALALHPHVETKPPPVPRPMQEPSSSTTSAVAMPQTRTSTPSKIVTTDSVFDNPPEMLSPPVPPRRQCTPNGCSSNERSGVNGSSNAIALAAAAVHAGIQRLEHNCWQDYAEHNSLQNDPLRTSSSSNNSNASASSSSFCSSGGSFVSAASSTFFHQACSCDDDTASASTATTAVAKSTVCAAAAATATAVPVPVPVPAPRQKKESLFSLQPHHLQPGGSTRSVAPSTSSQEDTMNDLISLDDSNNTSFDLEDFDPLNQNARPLPLRNGVSNGGKSTTLPAAASNAATMLNTPSISNPLYPYYTPQHTRSPKQKPQLPTVKPPPLPTSLPPPMPPPDEDFELLRKYGLDQFTLTTTTAPTVATKATNGNGAIVATSAGMRNWTTFD